MIKVSAPGKVHLTSAHIVVYGKPAILCAVDLRVVVSIEEKKQKGKIIIKSNFFDKDIKTNNKEIIEYTKLARDSWVKFSKTNRIEEIKSLTKPDNFVKITIGETLLFLKKEISDLIITVDSQVPVGANFGGSASVSTAICGAIFTYFGLELDKEKIYQVVYETEKRAHGNPSGGDPAVIIYGGLLWFRKETEFIKLFNNLTFPKFPDFLIVNSGKPEESTGEMVSLLRKLVNKRPKYVNKIFDKLESLKKLFITALSNNAQKAMIAIMKEDVRWLYKLDLVSENTKQIIKDLEEMGAGVSVSGACGRKSGSGALIVLNDDKNKIIKYCQLKNYQYYEICFGVEGVRVENG